MTWIALWGVTSIVCGALGYFLASSKNRGASTWAAWCVILPPAVLILALLPRNTGPAPRQAKLDDLDREQF